MSQSLTAYFGASGSPARLLPRNEGEAIRAALSPAAPALALYPESVCAAAQGLLAAGRRGEERIIFACGRAPGFAGENLRIGDASVEVCPADEMNMEALRSRLHWLRPTLTGLRPSLGLGDRLGLATPGHAAAGAESGFFLVLAQQSIREMTRTGRSAQQVMDEAAFGAWQCGYAAGFGADADHLKVHADVEATAAAGFTMFTLDPSDHVDDRVDRVSVQELGARFEKLQADGVPGAAGWRAKYAGRTFAAGEATIRFEEETLLKAAVKYGRAVAHAAELARLIAKRSPVHELELSVDETALPTSAAEHFFIARELQERGVRLNALAPRFPGDFEKGVDYKGDLGVFERSLWEHVQVSRACGPYKLSVHSGSDKFAIYPLLARITGGLFHLKTAGTSYLEALRVAARHDRPFFRELITFCRGRYSTDRRSYHVSAELDRVPGQEQLSDAELERAYLEAPGGRQILHTTFGSVLTAQDGGSFLFRKRLLALLNREAAGYVEALKKHLGRHIAALKAGLGTPAQSASSGPAAQGGYGSELF